MSAGEEDKVSGAEENSFKAKVKERRGPCCCHQHTNGSGTVEITAE